MRFFPKSIRVVMGMKGRDTDVSLGCCLGRPCGGGALRCPEEKWRLWTGAHVLGLDGCGCCSAEEPRKEGGGGEEGGPAVSGLRRGQLEGQQSACADRPRGPHWALGPIRGASGHLGRF